VEWSNFPEWLKLAMAGALSSLGTIVAGFFVARSDSRRMRTTDRSEFTQQLLDRLTAVEIAAAEERKQFRLEINARDLVIADLRTRQSELEQMMARRA
jgi:hypothetical protein